MKKVQKIRNDNVPLPLKLRVYRDKRGISTTIEAPHVGAESHSTCSEPGVNDATNYLNYQTKKPYGTKENLTLIPLSVR
jgi:hypothetical protein